MKWPYALATPYGVSGERASTPSAATRQARRRSRGRRLVEADRLVDLADRLEHRGDADGGELGRHHGLLREPARTRPRRGCRPRCGHAPQRARARAGRSGRPGRGRPLADRREVRVARRGAADDARDVVPLLQQELREQEPSWPPIPVMSARRAAIRRDDSGRAGHRPRGTRYVGRASCASSTAPATT